MDLDAKMDQFLYTAPKQEPEVIEVSPRLLKLLLRKGWRELGRVVLASGFTTVYVVRKFKKRIKKDRL